MLRAFDSRWVEHLTAMENMRQGIGLQSLAQRDPLVAYKTEGHEASRTLRLESDTTFVHTIYHVGIVKKEKPIVVMKVGKTESGGKAAGLGNIP
jgi:preprotein translocase subunit SecA